MTTVLILLDDPAQAADLAPQARGLGERVDAVIITDDPAHTDPVGPGTVSAGTVEAAGACGVGRLYVTRHELLASYSPDAWAAVVAELVDRIRPEGVLATAGTRPAEVLAHTAARLGAPLATHCVHIDDGAQLDDSAHVGHAGFPDTGGTGRGAGTETWRITRTRSGGVLLEDADLTAPVRMATVAPGCTVSGARHPDEPADSRACEVVDVVPELSPGDARVRLVERTEGERGLSLSAAPVVVSGGRGVGSAEGFAALEELADALGGVVGCSRVATSNGWRPHRDQVGLTGTKVAPELYIACGISGATQHWVGCMDSTVILAVNTDPEAPMMQRATYSVVGDVHEVLPAILAELGRRRAGGSSAATTPDAATPDSATPEPAVPDTSAPDASSQGSADAVSGLPARGT